MLDQTSRFVQQKLDISFYFLLQKYRNPYRTYFYNLGVTLTNAGTSVESERNTDFTPME